jgi:hypothetical protein
MKFWSSEADAEPVYYYAVQMLVNACRGCKKQSLWGGICFLELECHVYGGRMFVNGCFKTKKNVYGGHMFVNGCFALS